MPTLLFGALLAFSLSADSWLQARPCFPSYISDTHSVAAVHGQRILQGTETTKLWKERASHIMGSSIRSKYFVWKVL